MWRIEPVRDLDCQIENLVCLERLSLNTVLEGAALQVLHRDEVPAFILVDIIDGADVGMIQSGGCLSLASESLERARVRRHIFRQEFQGDKTAEFGVLGLVDDPHPPAAQLLDDPVVRHRPANHRKFSTSIRSLPASSRCV
jgi:hypothetical protein